MATVKIKNLKGVRKNIEGLLKKVVTSKKMLNEVGKFSRDRIVFNARTGKSLEGNNSANKFRGLSDFTIALRKAIKDTDPSLVDNTFFKSSRANVTLTGQLLKNLDYKVNKSSVFVVTSGVRSKINFTQLARQARLKFGSKDDRAKILGFAAANLQKNQATNNNQVYTNLKKLGFGFLGMDKTGITRIKNIVLQEYRRLFSKKFKN